MSQPKVRKAVIAAAGFGTRFLPQTKAMPKEMLPLVNKPIIQQIVEELVDAGITDIVIVTGYHKRTIEDHFDHTSADLKSNLQQAGKTELLEATSRISELANFAYIRQKGPFAQMLAVYQERGGSVITAIRRGGDGDYKRYGYIDGKELAPGVIDMTTIVEKPGSRDQAPSDLASVSGYLFEPQMVEYLQQQMDAYDPAGGEFMIQEAMQTMIKDGHHIYGLEIKGGIYYDTGNPLEYLKTVFDFALARDDIGPELEQHLRKKLG